MFISMRLFIVLAVMALTLAGCGDLLGRNVKKKEIGASIGQVGCELDMDAFTEIMNKNIESQINCLHENLKLFTKLVTSGKPGYLSRIQLERYLAVHRPDVKPEVVKALKSVFELGHVITGEEQDYISRETIDKVMEFLRVFNQEASLNFGPIFKSEVQVSYSLHKYHRDSVKKASLAIMDKLRRIYNPDRNGETHKLSIAGLIDSFTNEGNREDMEKAKKVLFVKKILLRGESDVLTHNELEKLLLDFDKYVVLALDLFRFKYIDLEQESILDFLKVNVDELHKIVFKGDENGRDGEYLFSMNEAFEAIKLFVGKDKFDVEKYRNLIGEAKTIVMHGSTTEVWGEELKELFKHARSLLNTGVIFYNIWDKFQVQLNSPQPVTIDFSEYRHTYPKQQAELDQFERIVKKYRFMRGKFLAPYYTRGFRRNAPAVFEIALYEYALKLVFKRFGRPNSGSLESYAMNREDMQKLIKKFKKELIDMDLLLPYRAEGLADNISLLGTLFQYQSDSNNLLDINEASEFATTVFTGMELQEEIFDYVKAQNCPVDQYDRIEPNCFRAHFWQGVCKNYKSNFPLMFESFGDVCADLGNNQPSQQLLINSYLAGRTCNYYDEASTKQEEVPFTKNDIMTTLVVLMHVETTIVRWDKNSNNILDNNEVNDAYKIYGPALDGFLEKKNPIIKKLKKQIYQFLLKYEQVPDEKDFKSIWKFVKFILNFNKNVTASRKTMAAVLVAIAKENAKERTGPQFDCEWLRNPENIPDEEEESMGTPVPFVGGEVLARTTAMINAYSDQMKALLIEELDAFTEDMLAGRVSTIKQVRQKNLKKLFSDIAADSAQMSEIRSLITEGSDLEKIGFAVSSILVGE